MTDEQKFLFDLNGFLIVEGVLPKDQCERIKEQIYLITHDPQKLPPQARTVPGGELAALIDHPVVEDILHEIIGPRLRLESGFVIWREKGQRHSQDLHQGGPIPDPLFHYHVINGVIRSALTRVVFELNDVNTEDGGTCFLPGSHKANFPIHPNHKLLELDKQSPFLYRPSYPAGSIIFFSENTAHGGPPWQNPHQPRVSAFYAYNHIGMQFHRPYVTSEVMEFLTDHQRSYFRDVWVHDFRKGIGNTGADPEEFFNPIWSDPRKMKRN